MTLSGCSGQLSALDPAGPRAHNLASLWWIMLAGSVMLFVLVMGLLALSYIRPKWLARLSPAHWIVGGGLILPLPILILLTGTAPVLGEQLLPGGRRRFRSRPMPSNGTGGLPIRAAIWRTTARCIFPQGSLSTWW
ncbi:hypothetical protein N8D56_01635 [Devosia sp. A8/3-2]|nr:hypothetical protein N8D56_01635 [Devosia sp. A8/3-2]